MTLQYGPLAAAAPYGLEVQYQFNGLTLNSGKGTLPLGGLFSNYAYYIQEIGGLDDADIAVSADNLPAAHGEISMPGFYGGRTITLQGFIRAINPYQLRVAQQNLREAFGQNFTEKSLIFLTGDAVNGDIFINCRKSAPLAMREQVTKYNEHRRDFLVTLRASDPRFLAFTSSTTASATNPANLANLSCTNAGNWSAYPTFTIHGPFNANLILTNTTTGVFTKLDTALLSTNTIVIDTAAKTVKDSQAANANRYSYLDPTAAWVTLEPGAQNIQLSGVAGGSAVSQVTVTWRSAWI